LILNQILLTSNIRNIWRIVRRIWMLILGLQGLNLVGLPREEHSGSIN